MKYIITDENIEIGDIVAFQTVIPDPDNGFKKSKKIWILGIYCEWYNPTFERFQLRFEGIDNEKTRVYKKEWIKKVKLL